MAELYVSTSGSDTNAGTKNSPFKTIEKASVAAKGGTTVHVAPGTYQGGITTETDGVTYVSDVKWGAKIVPGAGNDQREAWMNYGDNVTIDGFEVDGSRPRGDTPWLYGIYTGGSDSTVKNSKVHDLLRSSDAMDAASGGQGGAGIMADGWAGGTDIAVTGNTVYNIGPDGEDSTLVHGIYMATRGEVRNNVVHDVVGDGITSWHDATALTITGNTVYGANGAGIMIGAGDHNQGSGPNDNTTVSNNRVYGNRKGIEENGDTGSNNTFTGNTVRDNGTDWALQDGQRSAFISGAAAAGSDGADELSGGFDASALERNDDVDLLLSTTGNDTLAGDAGADVFSFDQRNGRDVVTGFDPREDRIQLTAGQDWTVGATSTGDARVGFTPAGSVTLPGVQPDQVTSGLFITG